MTVLGDEMTVSQLAIDQARQTNLISLAEQYTTLRKEAAKEYAGPCPHCGGVDRFHVKSDGWFCRQCHPQFGDAIALVRWMEGVDFMVAVQQLTGETSVRRATPKPHTRPVAWLDNAESIVSSAHARLMAGCPGADYLNSRGLRLHTWEAFNLGYREDVALPGTGGQERASGIVMPWTRGGKLTAIRYRFLRMHEYTDLDGKPRKAKQTAMPDSDFAGCLYGGQGLLGCAGDLRTLVLCEGEINALSIWQVAHTWQWDVLSLGSESAKLTSAAIDYARRFERVIVWMDKPEVARSLMALIAGAHGISSPVREGVKLDANDMLQRGWLGGLLATARFQACESDTERERLLWNLYDASQMHGGLDEGTRQVMTDIAKKLGKTL